MKLFVATFIFPFKVACWALMAFIHAVLGSRNMLAAVRKWRDKDKPTHGDAHYEDDKSLKKAGYFTHKGFLACVTRKGKRVYTHHERTVIVLAPPGIGKSQHFIADIRAKMERPDADLPHIVLGDAADELYANCAGLMAKRGYMVIKIDLVDPDGWSKYDVLSGLDTGVHARYLFGRQLDAIARLLVPDEPNSRQPHFVEFTRLLIKCAITVNVKYEGNNKPIGDIVAELVDEVKREDLFKRSKKYGDDIVTATLNTMAKLADKPEGLSMMTTALRKLEGWTDEACREVTNFGKDMHGNYVRGWRFEDVLTSKQPVALFLHTGTNETAAGPLARLIYGNAINAVSTMLDTGRKMERELEVVLDEAGLIGYCNAVSHAYNRLRKAGVRIRACFLGLEEFKAVYPDAKKILAGSDIITFGGSNELELGQYVSALAGEFTVHSRNESESTQGESKGKSEQPRRLVKPDELRRFAYEEVLCLLGNIVVRGQKPWKKTKGGIAYL